MYAIAQVQRGNLNNYVCELMNGPQEGSVWVIPDRYRVEATQMILVQYEEQDQFAHPVSMDEVDGAFAFQKLASD